MSACPRLPPRFAPERRFRGVRGYSGVMRTVRAVFGRFWAVLGHGKEDKGNEPYGAISGGFGHILARRRRGMRQDAPRTAQKGVHGRAKRTGKGQTGDAR